MYTGNQQISSCNNTKASYQYVEYQCIPTKSPLVTKNSSCPNDGSKTIVQIDRNGRFQSYNYPSLTQMDCIYRLKTKPGYIMNIYSLDISLNNYVIDCRSNKLTFIEDNDVQGLDFCEQRASTLIYSSCTNELDLRYQINDPSQPFSYGVELYIESQAHPSDWSCGETLSTSTQQTSFYTTSRVSAQITLPTNTSFTGALAEIEYDICFGNEATMSCPSGFTFMIIDAYYGVKSQTSNKCGFAQGDCVQEALLTINHCQNDSPNCSLSYLTKRRLARCLDKYADYLHISYQCVPSYPVESTSTLKVYNICETNNPIQDFYGIITSPNYPNYITTTNECQTIITGIETSAIKIWINEISIASDGPRDLSGSHLEDSNKPSIRDTCTSDYLIIDTAYSSYIYCGKRKLSVGLICSSSIKIQYKATSSSSLFYKGFKLYFELKNEPSLINCLTNPSTIDPLASTTPSNEPLPNWAQTLNISPMFSTHLCLGTSTTLRCPRPNDYVLSIVDSNYRVTGTGVCEIPSYLHCRQDAPITFTCTHSCFVEYFIPKQLSQCGNQTADYLNIDYQCIPTSLPNNESPMDICESTTTDTIAIDRGMMISPRYPSLTSASSCSKIIQTLPSKVWMIYMVDLFLEGEDDSGNCNYASLTIYDGKDKLVLCGLKQPGLVFFSCANLVQFSFVSNDQALGYRGFKVLFTTLDVPIGWSCVPDGFITTTTGQTSLQTTLLPPSLQSIVVVF